MYYFPEGVSGFSKCRQIYGISINNTNIRELRDTPSAQPIEDLADFSRWNSREIIELSFARIQTDLTQTDSHGAHASGVQAASFPIHHFLPILSRASLSLFGFIPP